MHSTILFCSASSKLSRSFFGPIPTLMLRHVWHGARDHSFAFRYSYPVLHCESTLPKVMNRFVCVCVFILAWPCECRVFYHILLHIIININIHNTLCAINYYGEPIYVCLSALKMLLMVTFKKRLLRLFDSMADPVSGALLHDAIIYLLLICL